MGNHFVGTKEATVDITKEPINGTPDTRTRILVDVLNVLHLQV